MTSTATPDAPPATPDTAPPSTGSMAGTPTLTGLAKVASATSRVAFRYVNRFLVVPLHRLGLAAWLGSPLTGWQCLVTTVGRRSGLPRPTPLGYLVADGAVWVLAGYGPTTLWYRNVLAEPRVALRLPGRRPMAATAEAVMVPEVRARIIPALCRSMALPGALIGCFPPTSSDARILECVAWVPLVRIRAADATPLAPGPDDPGGRAWVWRQAVALAGALLLACVARDLLRAR